jgi:hypothetical protein
MHADPTATKNRFSSASTSTVPHVIRVHGDDCIVRISAFQPIADVLGFEQELEASELADADTITDLLESRMITPPRPRRRRDRVVSSRAMFYAAGG